MSRLNTILVRGTERWAAFLVVIMMMTQPAHSGEPLHKVFAACAGRLSAEMEHQWLMSDPRADETEERREQMIALVQAVTPEGLEARMLNLRIEAKYAHRTLLNRASFSDNEREARWATALAKSEVSQCIGMLLS